MRIGLIISNNSIKKYELQELNNLIKNTNYRISYIFSEIKNSRKKIKIFEVLKYIFINRFFYLIYIEQKLASFFNQKNSFFEKVKDLEKKINIFQEFPEINQIKKMEFECFKIIKKYTFNKEMMGAISNNCDVIILLGFNKILHSEVLNITKYGILSFHTSDINKYRGRPAAFNEFINNEKFGGVTLQLLSEKLDFGRIVELRKAEIETAKSLDETLFRMMTLKKNMLIEGLNRIKKGENFLKPDTKCKLSTFAKSRSFNKVFSCLKKTINKRYLNK